MIGPRESDWGARKGTEQKTNVSWNILFHRGRKGCYLCVFHAGPWIYQGWDVCKAAGSSSGSSHSHHLPQSNTPSIKVFVVSNTPLISKKASQKNIISQLQSPTTLCSTKTMIFGHSKSNIDLATFLVRQIVMEKLAAKDVAVGVVHSLLGAGNNVFIGIEIDHL